jgi:heme-degrading monooxygenase HmoA
LDERINDGDRRIHSVTAWESEDACATYLVSAY